MRRTTVLAIGVLALGCAGAFAQEVELQKGDHHPEGLVRHRFGNGPVLKHSKE
jgi:hypothetical protein